MVGETIVVCRPEQLAEAAVVLSCCGADRFIPLIVIEPPPVTEAEYRRLYASYVQVRNTRDELTGGAQGREAASREQVTEAQREVDRHVEGLGRYRSWWRHQRFIASLPAELPLKRAVFLFEPPSTEINLIHPIPFSRISDDRQPTFSAHLEVHYLLRGTSGQALANHHVYESLFSLTEAAWSLCREGPLPERTIQASSADPGDCLAGLFRALSEDLPLRLEIAPARTPSTIVASARGGAPVEAVLIEADTNAANLLGVLYAHLKGATLIVYPAPDASGIHAARAAIESVMTGATKFTPAQALGELRDLAARAKAWLFEPPGFTDAVAGLERAVAAAVPSEVVAAVGDLDLTVLTSGVPYSFLKKDGADWAKKAIGHVAGDASLLILTDVCLPARPGELRFSLVFALPEFGLETAHALDVLQATQTYAFVVDEFSSSSVGLQYLAESLPIDVLFFNTHGSADAIQLRDGPFPAYKIAQRVTLSSHPFVFNSSCQSWVGVGREFIRVGARGYLGTLWSVRADAAAAYARVVLERVAIDGVPVSRAIHDTEIDADVERAYIFAGTCHARVARPVDRAPAPAQAEQALLRAARLLFEAFIALCQTPEGQSSLPFMTSLQDLLWTRGEEIMQRYDTAPSTDVADRLDLGILRLNALSHMAIREAWKARVREQLGSIDAALRQAAQLPPEIGDPMRARALQYGGRIQMRLGGTGAAVDMLLQAVQAARDGVAELQGSILLDLSDAQRAARQIVDARASAVAAHAVLSPAHAMGALAALGKIGQLSRRLGDNEGALRSARAGFEIATTLDNPTARAEFKQDEARALLELGRFEDAAIAAGEFLVLARLAHDDRREASALALIQHISDRERMR